MQNFKTSKKFGDHLEKDMALRLIQQIHPGCTIKSPDDTGIFREDGLAMPDHCVMQGKKIVVLYESKHKKRLYGDNDLWSIDEKLLEYRQIAHKEGVPCLLMFYCKDYDQDNVYLVDVQVEPKYHREVNNEYGQTMYGYHVSQTQPHPIQSKHSVNIRDEDRELLKQTYSVEDKKKVVLGILDRCTPAQSLKPMKADKIYRMTLNLNKCRTAFQVDHLFYCTILAGEGLSTNSTSYKKDLAYQ